MVTPVRLAYVDVPFGSTRLLLDSFARYNSRCVCERFVGIRKAALILGTEHSETNRADVRIPQDRALACIDESKRLHLSLRGAELRRELEEIREDFYAEENLHRSLAAEIERSLGKLRRDVADFSATVQRLEERLDRLNYASSPLSDDELDDQDYDERVASATFWAEWRQQREERQRSNKGGNRRRERTKSRASEALRPLYRKLARLIHPDLAADDAERARREAAMRLANAAYEAADEQQLQRLLGIWEHNDEPATTPYSVEDLTHRIEHVQHELQEIERRREELAGSETGELLRLSSTRRWQRIEREAEKLRRELASLRLKRRRLRRNVAAMREDLSEVSD